MLQLDTRTDINPRVKHSQKINSMNKPQDNTKVTLMSRTTFPVVVTTYFNFHILFCAHKFVVFENKCGSPPPILCSLEVSWDQMQKL